MSKKKVHHKKGHHKHHRRHHHKGTMHSLLGAVGTMGHELADTGMNVAAILAGAYAGNFAAKQLDSVLKVTPYVTGQAFNFMALISPVVLIGGGVAAAHFGKNNNLIKNFGYGLATAGVLHGTSQVIGLSLLSGVGDSAAEARVFRETEKTLSAIRNANNFQPQLEGAGQSANDRTNGQYNQTKGGSGQILGYNPSKGGEGVVLGQGGDIIR